MTEPLDYAVVPERARRLMAHEGKDSPNAAVAAAIRALDIAPRTPDRDGTTEWLGSVRATHRMLAAPGDSESIAWHVVEAGQGEPIVFLHGLPESWFMWARLMEALSARHRCIAIDLKGYGQSHKGTGDYRQEGVAGQLLALLDRMGLARFNLVTHDRGTVVADYLAAAAPHRVLRYVRSQQHFFRFHPDLAPQERLFTDAKLRMILHDAKGIVTGAFERLCTRPVGRDYLLRSVQEWMHPDVGLCVERYFASSSFRKEWIDRRQRLIGSWTFPVLVLQGKEDPRQPFEFYEDAARLLPKGRHRFIDAGHFFFAEAPEASLEAVAGFLAEPAG